MAVTQGKGSVIVTNVVESPGKRRCLRHKCGGQHQEKALSQAQMWWKHQEKAVPSPRRPVTGAPTAPARPARPPPWFDKKHALDSLRRRCATTKRLAKTRRVHGEVEPAKSGGRRSPQEPCERSPRPGHKLLVRRGVPPSGRPLAAATYRGCHSTS